MKIRTKLFLLISTLIGAVVLALATAVATVQRKALEAESQRRLQAVTDGVTRLAQESLDKSDPLMVLSYLMYLRGEHPELAYAAVTLRGHTSELGADDGGLLYWTANVVGRHPVKYTVTTVSAASNPSDSLSFSTSGVSLSLPGSAVVSVEEGKRTESLGLKLGFVRAALDAETDAAFQPLARRTAAVAGVFLALGWLGALTLSKMITSPLLALTAAAGAIKKGDLDARVAVTTKDEIGVLSERFNEMTAHLKQFTQFREDLLHTLTHELNTPLGGLKGYLELWQDRKLPPEGPERDEIAQTMSAAVLRMEHSLGSALRLFRAGAGGGVAASRKTVVWIDDLLREAGMLFAPVAKAKNVTLELPPDNVTKGLYGDEELLRQIVFNLISNALKYTSDGGRVHVSLTGDAACVRLQVQDNGLGIRASDLPHLFTKFYRSDEGERRVRIPGTGLGLNIALKAAQAHGGTITVSSELRRGSVFTVTLPKSGTTKEAA
jgi:signal transduction histidine kinase